MTRVKDRKDVSEGTWGVLLSCASSSIGDALVSGPYFTTVGEATEEVARVKRNSGIDAIEARFDGAQWRSGWGKPVDQVIADYAAAINSSDGPMPTLADHSAPEWMLEGAHRD